MGLGFGFRNGTQPHFHNIAVEVKLAASEQLLASAKRVPPPESTKHNHVQAHAPACSPVLQRFPQANTQDSSASAGFIMPDCWPSTLQPAQGRRWTSAVASMDGFQSMWWTETVNISSCGGLKHRLLQGRFSVTAGGHTC